MSVINTVLQTIKKWIFWSYDRKSWQYDVLCLLLILMLIFIPYKGPQRLAGKEEAPSEGKIIISEHKVGENLYSVYVKAEYSSQHKKDKLYHLTSVIEGLIKDKREIQQITPIIGENGEINGFQILIEGKENGAQ